MICSHCNTPMQEVAKTGILIDLCPQCKSVWLDRGEPEKILAQALKVERGREEKQVRFEQRPKGLR